MEPRRDEASGPAESGHELGQEELSSEMALELPDREAMSTIHGNFAMPINEATAANIYANNSVAIADADQIVIVDQVHEESSDA